MTRGRLIVDWDGRQLRLSGEMCLDPYGFELFDDLPIQLADESDEASVPPWDEVLPFLIAEFQAKHRVLLRRSERVRHPGSWHDWPQSPAQPGGLA